MVEFRPLRTAGTNASGALTTGQSAGFADPLLGGDIKLFPGAVARCSNVVFERPDTEFATQEDV